MSRIEKITEALRVDCTSSFACNIDGSKLTLRYAWNSKAGIIDRIDVYVCGIHPTTGKQLNRGDYTFSFSAGCQQLSRVLPLYGKYRLLFDAVTTDGMKIKDFREPYEIAIKNNSNRPFIRYRVENAEMKWTKLTVESNCFARLKGKLWVRCGGHMQKLPEMTGGVYSCYLALNGEKAELMALDTQAECPLPKPEKL